MSESTFRMRAEANVKPVLDYADAVARLRAEVQGYTGDLGAYAEAVRNASQTARSSPLRPSKRVATPDGGGGDGGDAGDSGGGGGGGGGGGRRGGGGGGRPNPSTGPTAWQRARVGGTSFLSNAASTAIGLGLGSSLTGFILGSGQTYMELSKVLTMVDRRFRDVEGSAIAAGQSMGFTIAQASQLTEAFGAGSNSVRNQSRIAEYLGFARYTGMDPGDAMHEFGELARMKAAPNLQQILGLAQRQGMDQGRLSELVRSVVQLTDHVLKTTGRADVGRALQMAQIPGLVFGRDDPRAQGMAGVDFQGRLNSGMAAGGPMRSFMLRAIGFGTDPNMSYSDAMVRMEEGATPENLGAFIRALDAHGIRGKEGRFQAIYSAFQGHLSAREALEMATSLGRPNGIRSAEGLDATVLGASFRSGLDQRDAATLAGGGFSDLGRQHISIGEGYEQQIESMRMGAGQYVARAMVDLGGSIQNLVEVFTALVGANPGKLLTDLTGAIERATQAAEAATDTAAEVSRIRQGARTGVELLLPGSPAYHKLGLVLAASLGSGP